jgi:hypothetical protein
MVGSTQLGYQEITMASKDVTTYRMSKVCEKSQGLKINSQKNSPQCFNFEDSRFCCVYQISEVSHLYRYTVRTQHSCVLVVYLYIFDNLLTLHSVLLFQNN